MKSLFGSKLGFCLALIVFIFLPNVMAQQQRNNSEGYIANQESVKGIFDALSTVMSKPVILSKQAARKRISGEFSLKKPEIALADISEQLGLIWYHDGQAIYVYDAMEMRNAIVVLKNTSFSAVNNFLRQSGLYDSRYPLRSDNNSSTFYVSGPPIYVDTVTNAAKFLDERSDGYDGQRNVAVIPLYNAFVEDRRYSYRGEDIVIPGIASIVASLLGTAVNQGNISVIGSANDATTGGDAPSMPDFPSGRLAPPRQTTTLETVVKNRPTQEGIRIVANANSNSLLVRGSAQQIAYVRGLVQSLDLPKRHIELSVWIVDLQKDALDQLGVQWSGNININNSFSVSLNGGTSTIDGASFMASALALSEKNKANIVSRPMILTQENVPAIFDNNRTFYTKLIGERTVELQNVTYGTLVSVLPRFTDTGEIEMMLNVEDGSQFDIGKHEADGLPEVGRTNISTIARVPRGKSLLIGGYTRDSNSNAEGKIPWLGDLPLIGGLFRYRTERNSNMIRVFLIQPREIDAPLSLDASQLVADMKKDLGNDQLHDWMSNYIDSQKWQ